MSTIPEKTLTHQEIRIKRIPALATTRVTFLLGLIIFLVANSLKGGAVGGILKDSLYLSALTGAASGMLCTIYNVTSKITGGITVEVSPKEEKKSRFFEKIPSPL